jgi:hypothetical protein
MGWVDEESRFSSQQQKETFLLFTASRLALEPTEPSTQWIPGTISAGGRVKAGGV